MIDIIIPLLFLAIFYLGPALLKTYRAKNTPPPAPEPEVLHTEISHTERMIATPTIKAVSAYMASAAGVQSKMPVENGKKSSNLVEEQSAWQGKLDQTMMTNGVIFAEILQPSRAYRPFVRR